MSEKIRVLLVDDHTLFRSGIKSLLQRNDDFEVVGEAGDGLEGIKRVRSLKPDVALLDLHMPGVSGLEAVKVISEEMPEVNVLMLTVSEDAQDLMDALRAGASGYLLKNIETDTLIEAIRKAAQGESVVSQQMTAKLIQGVRNPPKQEAAAVERDRFSPRERDILASLAQGESNKEIARKLDLAESTVKIHVQNIFKKLNMSSRVQVALYAVENGYGRLVRQRSVSGHSGMGGWLKKTFHPAHCQEQAAPSSGQATPAINAWPCWARGACAAGADRRRPVPSRVPDFRHRTRAVCFPGSSHATGKRLPACTAGIRSSPQPR